MKKILVVLFICALSLQSIASIKKKNIVGKWNYNIELGDLTITGVFQFLKSDGILSGIAFPEEGKKASLSKFEIDEKKSILRFELERENDIPIKFILNINKKDFKGKGWINDADFNISGKKQD